MTTATTKIDRNGDVLEFEFKSSDIPMDESQEARTQALDLCDIDAPALTTETITRASSTANLNDDIRDKSNNLEDQVKIDESSIPSIIEEICPVDGPCVQCEIEQPCSFRFTDNGLTLYVCNEPCIKAYQAEYPGKYTVTRKKYIIEEITPKVLLCSECEEKKTCYFYHNFHGEYTYYCSLNCLEGMMSDEKDKYTFKRNSVPLCIDQIRPKEGQCLICEKVKPCEFSLVRYGEPSFLCERACIKTLSGRERGRYYIKNLKVSQPDGSDANAIDKNLVQANTVAMAQREQSFHRRCSQCTLILMIDKNVLTWEAMDFCDEICLERFQNGIGSRCVKCNTLLQHTSLGKYCVRFGYDIQQFCNSSCLNEFKKGLKRCYYCQRDISASTQVLHVPVGDNKLFRHFCSQSCVEKLDQMNKNPEPQPVWAKCAVCSLEKATMIEMEVTETTSQRICSDPCFAAYKFVNNIFLDQCKCCKKYFERKLTNSFTIYNDSNPNCFCSLSCMTIHINHTRFLVSCDQCKSKKYNFDMIRRMDNDQAVTMCSLNCLSLYKVSANVLSSSNGPLPTVPPVSVEQGSAELMTLAAEQLITLTKSHKRRKTTQSSEQEEQQRDESPKKRDFEIRVSPHSRRKKETRSSSISEEMIEDLPVGIASETPEHPKKKRRLPSKHSNDSLIVNPWYQPSTGPSRTALAEGGQGSSAPPAPEKESPLRASPIGAHSSAISVGNASEARRKLPSQKPSPAAPSRHIEIADSVNYGSEEDSDDDDKEESCPYVSVPKSARLHFQDMDDEEETISRAAVLDFRWPPQPRPSTPPHASRSPPSPPRSSPPPIQPRSSTPLYSSSPPPNSPSPPPPMPPRSSPPLRSSPPPRSSPPTRPPRSSLPLHASPPQQHSSSPPRSSSQSPPSPPPPRTNSELGPLDKWHFEWREFPRPPRESPSERRERFVHPPSACGPRTPFQTPYEAFTAIWSLDIMDLIVRETNKYAQEVAAAMLQSGSLEPSSRIGRWKDVTTDEMYAYFAVILATGITVKSRMEEYWAKDLFNTPLFSSVISYDRFCMISKCLHFNSNSGVNSSMTRPEAKLYKIRPIIDHLNAKFSTLYVMSQNIALDESLTQWKGWLDINQFINNKAATVGVKTYEICESNSGYLWRFDVHAGHETVTGQEETPVSGLIPSLVLRLLTGLEDQGYTVWMDNYYNSPALARELKTRGFDCVGTLRTNRHYVPAELASLTKRDMVPGQILGCTSGDVDCVVWRDKNRVALISTYHGLATWECAGVSKPSIVIDYNICMGGVDRKDQMLAMYPIERKRTRVWYKKLFRRMLNASVLNAYIMLKKNITTVSHRGFRKELITQLLSKHSKRNLQAPRPAPSPAGHYPKENAHFTAAPGKRAYPLRRFCKICKKRTTVHCEGCDVSLCMFDCFKQYHVTLNSSQ